MDDFELLTPALTRTPPLRRSLFRCRLIEGGSVPKLFFGNFDFEHRLADPNFAPSEKLKRLNAELATAWLAMAEEGDWVWTPSPIDPQFFIDAASAGLPRIIPVSDLRNIPRGVECVPWGWSSEVRKLAHTIGTVSNAPSDEAVRRANSRATSEQMEREWNVGLLGAKRIQTLAEFREAPSSLHGSSNRWVVKAEFGMSARERILGDGQPSDSHENWVRVRLGKNGVVFFEPWVDRIGEIGIQIDIPRQGPPQLIGITPMSVDARGQYCGSGFTSKDALLSLSESWGDTIDVTRRAAKELQSFGYFGPLGIDSMIYRDNEGNERVRPLQDINARWTMGRLSLGFRRLIEFDECGFWQHSSYENRWEGSPFEPKRIIRTSPEKIGDDDCHHATRVILRKAD